MGGERGGGLVLCIPARRSPRTRRAQGPSPSGSSSSRCTSCPSLRRRRTLRPRRIFEKQQSMDQPPAQGEMIIRERGARSMADSEAAEMGWDTWAEMGWGSEVEAPALGFGGVAGGCWVGCQSVRRAWRGCWQRAKWTAAQRATRRPAPTPTLPPLAFGPSPKPPSDLAAAADLPCKRKNAKDVARGRMFVVIFVRHAA